MAKASRVREYLQDTFSLLGTDGLLSHLSLTSNDAQITKEINDFENRALKIRLVLMTLTWTCFGILRCIYTLA